MRSYWNAAQAIAPRAAAERFCARISAHGRRRSPHPMHALWRRDGNARSRTRDAVDAGSILGVQPLRPSFLDDLSAAEPRKTKNDHRVRVVTSRDNLRTFVLEDDDELDDEDDEFGDDEDDEDEDDDDDDEDDEEDEPETWQVRNPTEAR